MNGTLTLYLNDIVEAQPFGWAIFCEKFFLAAPNTKSGLHIFGLQSGQMAVYPHGIIALNRGSQEIHPSFVLAFGWDLCYPRALSKPP